MNIYDYKGVVFDLDGTLIQTCEEIADGLNDTLKDMNLPTIQNELVCTWIGLGTKTLFLEALSHIKGDSISDIEKSDYFDDGYTIFKKHYDARCATKGMPYDGVKEILVHLREKGLKLAVMTNKEGRFTDKVLELHDMTKLFDCIVSGDTLDVKKPNPKGLSHIASKMGVDVSDLLFVGDSSIDIKTARNANIDVWVLTYGYNMGQDIRENNPDRVFDSFRDIIK